jgi:Mn-dependent DtxR family transcriptional regulator
MTENQFRLPGSSYDELAKIIQAYAHFGARASNADISKRIGTDPTTVSRNGGFLVQSGIVDQGQKKEITDTGRVLARALEHDLADEVRAAWCRVIDQTNFFETILSAIRIRKGMDQSTLKSHIAYTAGLSKNQYIMTGAQTVIDILRAAGRIEEQDGRLIARSQDSESALPGSELRQKESHPATSSVASRVVAVDETPVKIVIQIQCTPADLEGLGEKLREVIRDLARPSIQPSDD